MKQILGCICSVRSKFQRSFHRSTTRASSGLSVRLIAFYTHWLLAPAEDLGLNCKLQ